LEEILVPIVGTEVTIYIKGSSFRGKLKGVANGIATMQFDYPDEISEADIVIKDISAISKWREDRPGWL
jgi:hypothetical protein